MNWSDLVPGDVLHGEPICSTSIWVVLRSEPTGDEIAGNPILRVTMMRLDDGSGKILGWNRERDEPVHMANVILAPRDPVPGRAR